MKNSKNTQIVRTLAEFQTLTFQGAEGLVLARRAIEHLLKEAGYSVAFDPMSEPDLVDALAMTGISGLDGAIIGGGIGAIIGILAKSPAEGFALGAALGFVAGGAKGVQRLRQGWRVRAVRDPSGQPWVTITAVGGR